jgi:hypothetical protein
MGQSGFSSHQRGRCAADFYRPYKSSNPQLLGPVASTLTTTPPRRPLKIYLDNHYLSGTRLRLCVIDTQRALHLSPRSLSLSLCSHLSAGSFGRKSIEKIVKDTERMKNTPIHVCAKTAFIGWPSTESRRISSFHNFLSCNHYFRKYLKLVYRKMRLVL